MKELSKKNKRKIKNNYRKRKKIVILGAGSLAFGLQTLVWLMRTDALKGMELMLVDVDTYKLERIFNLAKLLNDRWNANMKVNSSTKFKDSLTEADYIVITVTRDREKCWIRDIEMAKKYNISHVGENGGPGAFIHTARNLSIIFPILEEINNHCPNAFILNFTNPMQRICTAINKISSNRFMGLCHQIEYSYFILGIAFAKELNIEVKSDILYDWSSDSEKANKYHEIIDKSRESFDIRTAGLNHFTWLLDIREKNTDKSIYNLCIEKLRSLPDWAEPLSQNVFKIFDYFPIAGDNHISEYMSYTSDLSSGTYAQYKIENFDFDWYNVRKKRLWKKLDNIINGRENIDCLLQERSEKVEIIFSALEKNSNLYLESVNIPNNGCITNLPKGAIVDIPGIIGANGITGLAIGDLPGTVAELCRRQLIINDMTVEAILKGDRKLVYQLFALDPMVNNLNTAVKLADEYIKVNKDYLITF